MATPQRRRVISATGLSLALTIAVAAEVNTLQTVAPGVYFHEGDITQEHSNNGWVVFDDFVFLIDANFPAGAEIILPKIAATTDRPIRFVFDTHHHADHSYANRFWAERGATVVAHAGVLSEMQARETGYFGGPPGNWERVAKERTDLAKTKLLPPTVLFPRELVFDDGTRRLELHWFGIAHTKGDGLVWLPREKILFTGDVCVNGPYNHVGAANIREWIHTLEAVKQLGAKVVCPGHGPVGGPEIIADQQRYLAELQSVVGRKVKAGLALSEIKAALPVIADDLRRVPDIARFVPDASLLYLQVYKLYSEAGGAQ